MKPVYLLACALVLIGCNGTQFSRTEGPSADLSSPSGEEARYVDEGSRGQCYGNSYQKLPVDPTLPDTPLDLAISNVRLVRSDLGLQYRFTLKNRAASTSTFKVFLGCMPYLENREYVGQFDTHSLDSRTGSDLATLAAGEVRQVVIDFPTPPAAVVGYDPCFLLAGNMRHGTQIKCTGLVD